MNMEGYFPVLLLIGAIVCLIVGYSVPNHDVVGLGWILGSSCIMLGILMYIDTPKPLTRPITIKKSEDTDYQEQVNELINRFNLLRITP